jgi:rubrerythrin
MKRGHWTRGRSKARFTGVMADHEMGRKSECRNKGCTNIMLKGQTHYAAAVEGRHPHMTPGICERPEYHIGPYVLICRECGDKHKADPRRHRLRRK